MTDLRIVAAGAALLALGGCATTGGTPAEGRYAAGHFRAEAMLHDAGGAMVGTASVQEADGGLRATLDVRGLAPGAHGVHVHMTGKCDAPDFASAGGHWNPTAHQHGMKNPAGPHAGDLPNLDIGADGRGHLTFMLPGGAYEALLDEDGAAIVVHAKADDLATDPSGNSGGRIACGVLAAM